MLASGASNDHETFSIIPAKSHQPTHYQVPAWVEFVEPLYKFLHITEPKALLCFTVGYTMREREGGRVETACVYLALSHHHHPPSLMNSRSPPLTPKLKFPQPPLITLHFPPSRWIFHPYPLEHLNTLTSPLPRHYEQPILLPLICSLLLCSLLLCLASQLVSQ